MRYDFIRDSTAAGRYAPTEVRQNMEGFMITKEKVEEVLNKIRVGLKSEGGDIDLVEIKDDVVYVRLKGACGTCPMSTLTLKNWVETTLRKEIPQIKSVEAR
jgi:Fe-S cluster biogenesis protein NfuA